MPPFTDDPVGKTGFTLGGVGAGGGFEPGFLVAIVLNPFNELRERRMGDTGLIVSLNSVAIKQHLSTK